MSKYGFGGDDTENAASAPATLSLPKPKKKAEKPAPELMREAARAGETLGFVSREPVAKPAGRRPGRRRPVEPQDQINIAGPQRVLEAFRDYCDREQLQNYWTGLERLLEGSGKSRKS